MASRTTGPMNFQPQSSSNLLSMTLTTPNANNTNSPVPAATPEQTQQWIIELCDLKTREQALLELSKRREQYSELAVWIWHSFGAVAALLQEITDTYILMEPGTLTAHQSNRVCNALALIQCLASHNETRTPFLEARIPLFLYPFLTSSHTGRPFEYLRLTSLGVIGALVKTDDPKVVPYLLHNGHCEIVPLCLRIMDVGSELSKTVAVFIIQKILSDERGLDYMCATIERFTHVAKVLGRMIDNLPTDPKAANSSNAGRLFKHILRCYVRFSEHPKVKDFLREYFPAKLQDTTFVPQLREDRALANWMVTLCRNIGIQSQALSSLFPAAELNIGVGQPTGLAAGGFFRDVPPRNMDN